MAEQSGNLPPGIDITPQQLAAAKRYHLVFTLDALNTENVICEPDPSQPPSPFTVLIENLALTFFSNADDPTIKRSDCGTLTCDFYCPDGHVPTASSALQKKLEAVFKRLSRGLQPECQTDPADPFRIQINIDFHPQGDTEPLDKQARIRQSHLGKASSSLTTPDPSLSRASSDSSAQGGGIVGSRSAGEVKPVPTPPPLKHGQRLDQKTFLERLKAMPEDFRAELIGGVVVVTPHPSPIHSRRDFILINWLGAYERETPGTLGQANCEIMLDEESPVPDSLLLIRPEYGGQATLVYDDTEEDIEDEVKQIVGSPELVIEVSVTTLSDDRGRKKNIYESNGVREYIVVDRPNRQVTWFALRKRRFEKLQLSADKFYQSEVFPGLWLDADALIRNDSRKVMEVLKIGLDSIEHDAFVKLLQAQCRLR